MVKLKCECKSCKNYKNGSCLLGRVKINDRGVCKNYSRKLGALNNELKNIGD